MEIKGPLKKFGKISITAISAFLVVNLMCFKYYRWPGGFDRTENATKLIWNPGSVMSQGIEGWGSHRIDLNGYVNPKLPLKEKDYILALGSSHTLGKEVKEGERYTDLLNQKMGAINSLEIYNMGIDGHMYPSLVQGFDAAIQEFPYSKVVILEITETTFKPEELEEALIQREYSSSQNGNAIKEQMDLKSEMRMWIKENMPFLSLLKNRQFAKLPKERPATFSEKKNSITSESYVKDLSKTMGLIRNEYKGKIIIMYHPYVDLKSDGSMDIIYDNETYNLFKQACIENNIVFLDVGPAFLDAYNANSEVPYGFSNQIMAYGHLNKVGHRIVAEQLYAILRGENQ